MMVNWNVIFYKVITCPRVTLKRIGSWA